MGNPKIGDQGAIPVVSAQPPPVNLLQQDFPYQDNVDGAGGFPLNLDYFIPINCQSVITGRLSFKRRAYRTYNNVSGVNSGAGTNHTHSIATEAIGESGHSHNHSHSWHIFSNSGLAGNLVGGSSVVQTGDGTGAMDIGTTGNANGSSGHTHNHGHGGVTGGEASHTHALNLTAILGVTEGTVAAAITIKFDGVDQTANLLPAGPYSTDQVEMDVTKFISTVVDRSWHTISFTPSGLGRIQAVLRILYHSNEV